MGILAWFGAVTLPFRSKMSVDQFPPPYGAFRPYLAFEPVEEFPSGTRAIPKTVSNDSLGSSLTFVPSPKASPNPSVGRSMDLRVENLSGPYEGATVVTQPQFHRSAPENTLAPSPESSPVPSLKGLSLKAFLASLDDRSSMSELNVDQPIVEEVIFLSRAELRRVASEFSLECSLTSSSLPTSPVLPPKTGKDPSPGKCGTSSRGRKVWARIRKALTACLCCCHTCQESEDIPL